MAQTEPVDTDGGLRASSRLSATSSPVESGRRRGGTLSTEHSARYRERICDSSLLTSISSDAVDGVSNAMGWGLVIGNRSMAFRRFVI